HRDHPDLHAPGLPAPGEGLRRGASKGKAEELTVRSELPSEWLEPRSGSRPPRAGSTIAAEAAPATALRTRRMPHLRAASAIPIHGVRPPEARMDPSHNPHVFHATTIVSVRRDGRVAVAGDGQVTLGNTVMKANARKIRRLGKDGQVIAGFAGAAADAFTLFEL